MSRKVKMAAIHGLLAKLGKEAIDLLFPMHCAGCRRPGGILCETCLPGLAKLTPPFCRICGSPNSQSPCRWCEENAPSIDGVRAPFLMEGAVQQSIFSLKYRGIRAAAPDLARLLAGYLAERRVPGDLIVAVPLHRRRLRTRGYNQSELLAGELSKVTGLPRAKGMLARVKDAPPQVEAATRSQRRSNVEGCYEVTGDAAGRRVLLIDDVVTTGSTMSSCAAALKEAGAASVWGLALAREA